MVAIPTPTAHINIIGFRSAVAALVSPELRGRPYVIALGAGGRTLVCDVSPEAMKEGIMPGMAVA
ncbi:MAG: DNA polymerase, partial [Treponema sp.]|nr:DNA polymerase [Treponema sp.]